MIDRRRALAGVAASMTVPALRAIAAAPRVLRIVVPFPAGTLDGPTRILADAYQRVIGGTCIVDSRPGAAGIIGSLEVSRAQPDGATLLWTTTAHLTNAVLMKKRPYDPMRDFTPVSMMYSTTGFALMHRIDGPFGSIAELVVAARKEPGKYSFGSLGIGHPTHVMGVMFTRAAGIEMIHVPYKGSTMPDLMAGRIDVSFSSPSTVKQFIDSRKIKALAIGEPSRVDMLPDVPTFAELGMPDVAMPAWVGMMGPPKMPPEVLSPLYAALAKAQADARFNELMTDLGNQVVVMPPEAFKAYLEKEYAHYQKILPPLGIQMDF